MLKKIFLSIIFFFVFLFKTPPAPFIESKPSLKPLPTPDPTVCFSIPILTYHYVEFVTDEKDTIRQSLNINPLIFENQLRTLKDAGFQLYAVRDIPDILSGKIPYASKSAVLTFDDGHRDFYTDVLPILEKYQTKATVFIIYDFINGSDFMTEKQLLELTKHPLVEIGSHTLSHNYLSSSSSVLARQEISGSKQKLEELLGCKITSFAYPYGSINKNIINLVKEASYSAAVSSQWGICQTGEKILSLPRIKPGRLEGKNLLNFLQDFPIDK